VERLSIRSLDTSGVPDRPLTSGSKETSSLLCLDIWTRSLRFSEGRIAVQHTSDGVQTGIYYELVDPESQMLHYRPDCGHGRSFARPPLAIVTGAAGTGKTAVRRRFAGEIDAVLREYETIGREAREFETKTGFSEYVL
jgi:hypothetical protein